jgi:hypothetical protein
MSEATTPGYTPRTGEKSLEFCNTLIARERHEMWIFQDCDCIR